MSFPLAVVVAFHRHFAPAPLSFARILIDESGEQLPTDLVSSCNVPKEVMLCEESEITAQLAAADAGRRIMAVRRILRRMTQSQ